MNETSPDVAAYASSLVGILVPWIVAAIRQKWLPWSNKAAIFLSFCVATVVFSFAYGVTDSTPTFQEWFNSLGGAFTLSQLVYRLVGDKLKDDPKESGDDP